MSADYARRAAILSMEEAAYGLDSLNYSTSVGFPVLRFGFGSIASKMMIGKQKNSMATSIAIRSVASRGCSQINNSWLFEHFGSFDNLVLESVAFEIVLRELAVGRPGAGEDLEMVGAA
jgi:hypothetical protein